MNTSVQTLKADDLSSQSNETPSSATSVKPEVQQIPFEAEAYENDVFAIPDTLHLERWNKPRINIYRWFATLYSFLVLGMNDAANGALIPYLETYYGVDYVVISLVFLAPAVGYVTAAVTNAKIHQRFGQVGIAIIGPACHLAAYTILCFHPPYFVLPLAYTVAGFGTGLLDGSWNAWVGNMTNANELLGLLHGAYGIGAAITPLIATSMITRMQLEWFNFYYLLVGLSVFESLSCVLAFRNSTGAVYRATHLANQNLTSKSVLRQTFESHVCWICSIFLFFYVGIEVGLGGWLVSFMLRVRHSTRFLSGLTATGFWLGLTTGRIVLGFVTGRVRAKFAVMVYIATSVGLELCFWLIPNARSSAVFAALVGFFLGPMFPAIVVASTKLLPRHLHLSAIGFAAAIGCVGAAVFPFLIGAIAQSKGVGVLPPVVLVLLILMMITWSFLPDNPRKARCEV